MAISKHPLRFLLWTVWVLASLALIGYGRALDRIDKAQALYWNGSPDAAVDEFAALNTEFQTRAWMARLLPAQRERVRDNYLRLLYGRGDFDSVIAEAETSLLGEEIPSEQVRYWLGNAYYRKAMAVASPQKSDESTAWLRRAGEQYQAAIARSSEDWDLKYNHELVQTLLGKVNQKSSQEKVMDILRPSDKNGPQPPPPRGGRVG